MDENERRIYQAPLQGVHYRADTRSVWLVLKNLLADTTAWEWIRSHEKTQSDQAAMESLRQHYDGRDQRHARIATATNTLQSAHIRRKGPIPGKSMLTN